MKEIILDLLKDTKFTDTIFIQFVNYISDISVMFSDIYLIVNKDFNFKYLSLYINI